MKKNKKTLLLRIVTYRDDNGRIYEFITNNIDITNEEVALIYKIRWRIELLFKKLKQNFPLHYFYSETENGIKTQKAFSTVAAMVRIHLISNLDVFWVIENSRRTYTKRKK